MNRTRILLGISGLALALGAVTLFFASRGRSARAAQTRDDRSTAQFASRVAGVEAEVRAVRALLSQASAAQPAEAPTGPSFGQADPENAPETSDQPELSQDEHRRLLIKTTVSTLEGMVASEARDVAWERASQRALAEVFASPELARSRPSSVTCAQTLCKIVIRHEDRAARSQYVEAQNLVHQPFPGPGFSHYSKATNETHVYAMRQGTELPKITVPAD